MKKQGKKAAWEDTDERVTEFVLACQDDTKTFWADQASSRLNVTLKAIMDVWRAVQETLKQEQTEAAEPNRRPPPA